jgi:feruloyl esterase
VLSTALLASLVGIAGTPAAAATCMDLRDLTLPDTAITAAEAIPAGTYTAPDGGVYNNLPAFCRIAATLTPTSDSDIKIEVWMPHSRWNGRYVGTITPVAGTILYRSLAHFLPLD